MTNKGNMLRPVYDFMNFKNIYTVSTRYEYPSPLNKNFQQNINGHITLREMHRSQRNFQRVLIKLTFIRIGISQNKEKILQLYFHPNQKML